MFKKLLSILIGITSICLVQSCSNSTNEPKTIEVNGVSLQYIVEGRGTPVILLHGNGGSYDNLKEVGEVMKESGFKVYLVDSRGQGHNAPIDEYHYQDMAEDIFQFIEKLKIEKPALLGWSDGGIVGLELALAHPGSISSLAVCGANIFPEGVKPDIFAYFKEVMNDPSKASALFKMMIEEPQIIPESLKEISIPVLVMAGSDDMILESHTKLISDNIPNSTLLILEGETHGSYVLDGRAGKYYIEFLNR